MDTIVQRIRGLARPAPVVTVLRLYGAIGVGGPFGRALDDAGLAGLIERAFAPKRLAAVALASLGVALLSLAPPALRA